MSVRAYLEREKRGDFRAGVIAATLININRDPKKQRKAIQPKDIFTSLQPPRRPQTPEQMRRALLAFAAMSGGRVKRVPREEYEAMTHA